MLRSTPPGEDTVKAAANGAAMHFVRGEDTLERPATVKDDLSAADRAAMGEVKEGAFGDDLGEPDFNEKPSDAEFLKLVGEADRQASFYVNQINRRSWERTYKAYHQEHFQGSKYNSDDFRNRSKLFIPKTRAAIRKDMASVAASLFGSIDAITCMPGNEGDEMQRASAAVIQELINYRTDRSNDKASMPWFLTALGSRQTALLTGFVMSKQSWKLELKRAPDEPVMDEETGEPVEDDDGPAQREVWVPDIDRPDCQVIPPENVTIDPAADWTNPAQDSAYVLIKWPMRLDEIRRKQLDPRMPWKDVDLSKLKSSGEGALMEAQAIRRAREEGLDRYDETQTGPNFDIIWVWETYIRTAGQDWTFLSIGSQYLLTDPRPVEEVYPEQFGQRPLVFGYGSLEAFRVFPMSPAESWQPLQMEANDLRNLSLDSIKQSVMPVTKVKRGQNIDLEQLKKRGTGSAIMVTNHDDVTWEKVPDISGATLQMTQTLGIEFDDLAGVQNYGNVQDNNQLGKTLGGLKLAAGAANAVQEFDVRVWIETWCEPVLSQIVRLEQYYESDPIILGLCGERAQVMQKFGINEISDELLENNVTLRVNIGLGSGDPQQRLAKFQSAVSMFAPLAAQSQEFQSGEKAIDIEAVAAEIFGAAGYRDGGKRFFKQGKPQQNPMQQPEMEKLQSETNKNNAMAEKAKMDAKAGIVKALSDAAKVGIDTKRLEADLHAMGADHEMKQMDMLGRAVDMGMSHGQTIHGLKNPKPQAGPATGGALVSAGAEAIVPTPDAPGAGNRPLSPDQVGTHGVPAANAGEQRQADATEQGKKLDRNIKNGKKVRITGRDEKGRANAFEIME